MDIMNSTLKQGNATGIPPSLPYYQQPMALKATTLTVQVVIALVGVVGNLLVCIVITKRANMKTTMNLYLRNLAIADLGVLLVNFPLVAISFSTTTYPFNKIFCLYIAPATEIFFGASIWSITIIAIERYKNIISSRSFGKRAESSKKITLKILVIWVVSFLVVAGPMYPYMFYHDNGIERACYPVWPANMTLKLYTVGLTVFWYLLPLAIITFTYMKISRRLVQSNQFHKGMHGDDLSKSRLIREEEKQRLKLNKKAQRILTPLVVVFALSMLPLNMLRLTFAFYQPIAVYKFYEVMFSVCALFVVVNSAADPIVYYLSSKEFRKVIQSYLCIRGGEAHGESTVNSVNTVEQTKI